MRAEGQTVRGMAWLLIGSVVAQALYAVTGWLLARRLGPSGYGLYATAFALASVFTHTPLMGLDSVVPREIARAPASAGRIVLSALYPVIAWVPLLTLLIGGLGLALGYPRDVRALIFFAAAIIGVRGLSNLLRSAMRGLERMDLDTAVQVVENGMVLIGVALALGVAPSVFTATQAMLAAELLALIPAGVWVGRLTHPRGGEVRLTQSMILAAFPLGLTFILIGLNVRIDTLVLSRFRPVGEVGLYNAALGVVTLSCSVSAMAAAFLPRLSAMVGRDDGAFLYLRDWGFRLMLALGVGMGSIIGLLAPFLMQLLYGAPFLPAAAALRVLGGLGLLSLLNTYFRQVLIASGEQGAILRAVGVALLFTFPLALALIPRQGVIGAATVSLTREIIQTLLLARVTFRRPLAIGWPSLGTPFLAALAMALVLWPVRRATGWETIPFLLLALGVYLTIMLIADGELRAEVHRWAARQVGGK